MLDSKGFDLWADGYDKTVGLSEEDNSYPFAGYKEVLAFIYNMVLGKKKPVVLDIGFGTGTLTAKLYAHGCEIYGQDFSAKMIELAKEKMPDAHLCQGDFSQGLAAPLLQKSYDFIIATYSLHHLTEEQKVTFLRSLRGQLADSGRILIGDVAFNTRADMEACRQAVGEEWDDEEFYFVAEELQKDFPNIQFQKISHCAGILILQKTD